MAAVSHSTKRKHWRGDRLALWVLVMAAVALDAALLRVVADTYGVSAVYWLVRNLRSDPLVAWLALDVVAMRAALFFLGVQLLRDAPARAAALLLVPIVGGPLALLALLGPGDDAGD